MKRRRLEPDLRPDWRDPNMPCFVSTKSQGMTEWAPNRVQRVAAAKLNFVNEPSWRNDPTYNMKAKRNV
jgi:hypothetical protein